MGLAKKYGVEVDRKLAKLWMEGVPVIAIAAQLGLSVSGVSSAALYRLHLPGRYNKGGRREKTRPVLKQEPRKGPLLELHDIRCECMMVFKGTLEPTTCCPKCGTPLRRAC